MKEKTTKPHISGSLTAFLIGGILGGIIFLLIFGTYPLDPTNTEWIAAEGGDMLQHQIGWEFFRRTPWKFPIGLADGLISSGAVSCLYTDSIPFFAVIFKLLSPVLPETFQYFGIWEMFCFIMTGGVSSVLLYKIKPNYFFSACGSTFYVLFPPTTSRIFHHDALIAIWLILIAFILCIDQCKEPKHKYSAVVSWSLLGVISVLTHMYFLPMIYMVMAAYIFIDIFQNKKISKSIAIFVSTTVCSLTALFCIGAFYGEGQFFAGGFGIYSANFNTFFNGHPVSKLIPTLPTEKGQYEGYGFLGLGALLLLAFDIIICIILLIRKKGGFFRNTAEFLKKHKIPAIAVFLLFTGSFIWAVSQRGVFNDHVLYDIPLPRLILGGFSIFRASGRFIWISGLVLITVSFYLVSKADIKIAAAIITLCAVIQTADSYDWYVYLHKVYGEKRPSKITLISEHWDGVTENVNEIIFLPLPLEYLNYTDMYFNFAVLASEKKINLSSFYLARSNYELLSEYADEQYELLKSGKGRNDALYVFFDENDVPDDVDDLKVYNIDNYTVARVES